MKKDIQFVSDQLSTQVNEQSSLQDVAAQTQFQKLDEISNLIKASREINKIENQKKEIMRGMKILKIAEEPVLGITPPKLMSESGISEEEESKKKIEELDEVERNIILDTEKTIKKKIDKDELMKLTLPLALQLTGITKEKLITFYDVKSSFNEKNATITPNSDV
jgi:hypothetical protein